MYQKRLWFVICLGILIPMASASFSLQTENIGRNYLAGDKLTGSLTLNLTNEPSISLLTSNLEGNITLLELIKLNQFTEGEDYNCSSFQCQTYYKTQIEITGANLADLTTVGFLLSGNQISSINSISFRVRGDGSPSCFAPFSASFLENESRLLLPTAYTTSPCFSKRRGCFNLDAQTTDAILSNNVYCERLLLPQAPAFLVGADVKKETGGEGDILMQLRDVDDNTLLGECTLPPLLNLGEYEPECIIPYPSIKEQEYLVCIGKKDSTGTARYTIKTESQEPLCGTDSSGFQYTIDYNIFARSLQYAPLDLRINDSFYEEQYQESLSENILTYLQEHYKTTECIPSCVIPISVKGRGQEYRLIDFSLEYTSGNTLRTDSKIYKILPETATVNSLHPLLFELSSSGFKIPSTSRGNTSFMLFMDGKKIFPSPLTFSVAGAFGFDVYPLNVSVATPVEFRVFSKDNITHVSWNFGDNTPAAEGKRVFHTYLTEGSHTLRVTAIRSDGYTLSREYNIQAAFDMRSIEEILQERDRDVANIARQIASYPPGISQAINNEINMTFIENSLRTIRITLSNSTLNSSAQLSLFLNLPLPKSIQSLQEGTVPLFFSEETADMNYLLSLTGSDDILDNEQQQELRDKITIWMLHQYSALIDYKVISAVYGDRAEPILTAFSLRLEKLNISEGKDYFIIDYPPGSIHFIGDYESIPLSLGTSTGTAVRIDNKDEVVFTLSGVITVEQLGAYLAPDAISRLSEIPVVVPHKPLRWGQAAKLISLLILGILVVYIALQEWYKRYYENYLFPQQSDLYNVIHFIYNGRVNGLADNDISSKLRSMGWKGEQTVYAFKKIDGRRTGMFELPLFRFIEGKKVRQELQRRHPRPLDVRFIKRPAFTLERP